MKLSATRSKWLFLALAALSLLTLSACSTAPATHDWLEAPGWSRSRLIAETESAYPVLPAVDEAGTRYFAVTHIIANVPIVEVFALDPNLDPLWQTEIPLERLKRANKPGLILSNRGLEVFWLLDDSLFSAVLDTQGSLLREPARLSGSNYAAYYDVTLNADGERLLWFSGDRSRPGIYAIDPAGNLASVNRDGHKPQILLDGSGDLHAAWLDNDSGDFDYEFYYAYYPDAAFAPDREQLLYTTSLSVTSGLFGPELGLDASNVYLFWSELVRTGPSAGAVSSKYIDFPLAAIVSSNAGPAEISAEISAEAGFLFPDGYNLNYRSGADADAGSLQAGPRAYPEDQAVNQVPRLNEFYANPISSGELVVASRSRLPFLRNKEASQIVLTFLEDDQITSYQLLSFSPGITEQPAVRSDTAGYLHATWLEQSQSGEYRLYYATTEPTGKAALDTLTSEDNLRITGNSIFGLLSGLVLIPFPIFWALGPVALSFFTGFLRCENEPVTAPGTLITLVVGLAIYWVAKIATIPGILTYAPFSAWIPILPESFLEPLRIGMPTLVGLIGLLVAYRATYGRHNNTPLFFFLIYALVDGLITIALYGVLFYGAI